MDPSRVPVVAVAVLAITTLLLVVSSSQASAGDHAATYLIEDPVYTEEQTTSNRDVLLEGEIIKEAWFNFTAMEDESNSNPDSFLFTVSNMDDAEMTQSIPGTTDAEGRLYVPIRFTLETSPRWRVSVTCTDAGDTMLGPLTLEEDAGNAWNLQVDYVYWVDEGGNGGNGGNGGGGGDDGGDDDPALVTVMEANYLLVALMSLMVIFLSLGVLLGDGGSLKLPLVLSGVLLLDNFVFAPIALVVNLELNDAVIATPPFGPAWLGNLALVLLALWAVPFLVAKKRVMGSDEVHGVLAKATARSLADAVRGRSERFAEDPLSTKRLAVLLVALGVISLAVLTMILLGAS